MTIRSAFAPALAATSGLMLLAAHPPVGWWPLVFLAPALLVASLWIDAEEAARSGRQRRAFRLGALMGAAAFAPMLSWLIMPAGVIGWFLLVLVQGAWFGALAWLLAAMLQRWWLPIGAGVVWTGIDAWRGMVPLNGFDWGAIAYAHVQGSWLLPVARLSGGRGITFLTVLIGVAAAVMVRSTVREMLHRGDTPVDEVLGRTRRSAAIFVAALLVSVLATVEPPDQVGTLDVLAVQGNDVRHWEATEPDPDPALRIATALRDETLRAVARGGEPQLTVWPESSLDRDPFAASGEQLGAIANEAADAVGRLLTGATLEGPNPTEDRFVAASLLNGGLNEVDRYVKRRLVPFGEYVPARSLLGWFPPLEQVPRDAIPGDAPQSIEVVEGVRAAVLICFETMFADVARSNLLANDEPAQILLTMTNDASFGDSPEHPQHLAQSQLRAVETGRWVVHSSITGRSAFVDQDGGVHQATGLFTVDSIRRQVPLVSGLTPYLVVGDVVGTITRIATAMVAGWVLARRLQRARLRPRSHTDSSRDDVERPRLGADRAAR